MRRDRKPHHVDVDLQHDSGFWAVSPCAYETAGTDFEIENYYDSEAYRDYGEAFDRACSLARSAVDLDGSKIAKVHVWGKSRASYVARPEVRKRGGR